MKTSNARKRNGGAEEIEISTVKLGAHRDVRLPEEVARKLKLRKGCRLGVVLSGDTVILVPWSRIPKDQRYFYTREWQLKEREADEAIARGDLIGPFDDAASAVRALRAAKA